MKTIRFPLLLATVLSALCTGCITHEETVYRDVSRVKVEFENDAAARLFYERLHENGESNRKEEISTSVAIPVVFGHKRRVVTGDNWLFNEAVSKCDTNRDGRITEQEARIYSEQKPVRKEKKD